MKRSLGAKTIVLPTPVFIIGSYDEKGRPNMMNAAWGGICNSDPPCVAVSVRPTRKTHANIRSAQAFTVNIPSAAHVKQADYVGIYSGADEDKFAATGLTATPSTLVHAPVVEEFVLVLECRVVQEVELGSHTQFIGEIVDVKADEAILVEDVIDVDKADVLTFSPSDAVYYRMTGAVGQAFEIGRKA